MGDGAWFRDLCIRAGSVPATASRTLSAPDILNIARALDELVRREPSDDDISELRVLLRGLASVPAFVDEPDDAECVTNGHKPWPREAISQRFPWAGFYNTADGSTDFENAEYVSDAVDDIHDILADLTLVFPINDGGAPDFATLEALRSHWGAHVDALLRRLAVLERDPAEAQHAASQINQAGIFPTAVGVQASANSGLSAMLSSLATSRMPTSPDEATEVRAALGGFNRWELGSRWDRGDASIDALLVGPPDDVLRTLPDEMATYTVVETHPSSYRAALLDLEARYLRFFESLLDSPFFAFEVRRDSDESNVIVHIGESYSSRTSLTDLVIAGLREQQEVGVWHRGLRAQLWTTFDYFLLAFFDPNSGAREALVRHAIDAELQCRGMPKDPVDEGTFMG